MSVPIIFNIFFKTFGSNKNFCNFVDYLKFDALWNFGGTLWIYT